MNLFTRKAASVAALTVLGLTAGGIAWAESTSAPASSDSAVASAAAAGDPTASNGPGARMHGLGKRVLHGEVVLQTRKGFVTAVIARGTVTAIDANSISVKSADGVTSTFAIDDKTKARSAGHVVPLNSVHVGDKVGVLGVKNGSAVTAKVIRKLPASADNT